MAHSLEGTRKDVVSMNPWDPVLVVVGRDKPFENAGPEDPAYDPRAKRAPVQETVDLMKRVGVQLPIKVEPREYKDKVLMVIRDGRGRIINAREAWMQQKDAGVPEDQRVRILVAPPMTARAGYSATDIDMIQIALNEHRDNDPMAVRAEKIAMFVNRLVNVGGMDEGKAIHEACLAFRLKPNVVRESLRVNGASLELKGANVKGEIGDTVLLRLSSLPVSEQPKALEELKAKGGDITADDARAHVTTVNARKKATKSKDKADDDGGDVVPARRTLKKLLARIEAKESGLDEQAQKALVFVLTGKKRGLTGLAAELRAVDEVAGSDAE